MARRKRVRRGKKAGESAPEAVFDPRFGTREHWEWEMARMPPGAIGADQTKHASHNSYSPKFWYEDRQFTCRDCGRQEVWTAAAQKWWYEVAAGTIHSTAVRCRACRKAARARRAPPDAS